MKVFVFVPALLATASALPAAVIFADDFSTNTAMSYSVRKPVSPDSVALFGFNYAGLQTGNNGTNGAPFQIPAAPRTTDGTQRALFLEVNPNQGTAQAVNVYTSTLLPPNVSYTVTFDAFARVPSNSSNGFLGGTGSTQRLLFGINHSGEKMVNITQNAPQQPKLTQDTDGYYFGVAPDGGFGDSSSIGRDYEFRRGTLNTSPYTLTSTWFGAGSAESRRSSSDPNFRAFLSPARGFYYNGRNGGAPGDNWVTYRVRWDAPTGTFYMDLKRVGDADFFPVFSYTDDAKTFNGGRFMVGLEDPTDGTASSLNRGFHLIDNIVIETTSPLTSPEAWMLK